MHQIDNMTLGQLQQELDKMRLVISECSFNATNGYTVTLYSRLEYSSKQRTGHTLSQAIGTCLQAWINPDLEVQRA